MLSPLQKSVTTEAEDNNDIVLEDFHDTYLNLTLKTTFLLKWVTSRCSNAKFVFKVDDDVFVNPEKLWSTLESSHLFSVMVNIPDKNNKMVASNIDYALIGLSCQEVLFTLTTGTWLFPRPCDEHHSHQRPCQ